MGKKRTRRSAQQWQTLLDKHEHSDLSAPEFCKAQGIAYQSFMKWRQRLSGKSDSGAAEPKSSFIELTAPAGTSATESNTMNRALSTTAMPLCIELSLGSGIELRITRSA